MDHQIAPKTSGQPLEDTPQSSGETRRRVADTQQHVVEARQHVTEANQTLAAAQQAQTTADEALLTASQDADLAVQRQADHASDLHLVARLFDALPVDADVTFVRAHVLRELFLA